MNCSQDDPPLSCFDGHKALKMMVKNCYLILHRQLLTYAWTWSCCVAVSQQREHRASCHRCGNMRKRLYLCKRCPYVYCQRCAEKMVEEHGDDVFVGGCPVVCTKHISALVSVIWALFWFSAKICAAAAVVEASTALERYTQHIVPVNITVQ